QSQAAMYGLLGPFRVAQADHARGKPSSNSTARPEDAPRHHPPQHQREHALVPEPLPPPRHHHPSSRPHLAPFPSPTYSPPITSTRLCATCTATGPYQATAPSSCPVT